jgi:SPP1 family predicted phage head-tail adaptor
MAQITYTPLGDMRLLVDFWDQETTANPDGSTQDATEFAGGVYAKIESLWATTQARMQRQQAVTETTHRITIRYMPGLRTRMFILYNDPDTANPRRFDIDSINDPDEMTVELQILAIERNDGGQ